MLCLIISIKINGLGNNVPVSSLFMNRIDSRSLPLPGH